jgi:hypothetical protein
VGSGEGDDLPMNGRDGQGWGLQRQCFNPLYHVWRHPAWDARVIAS